MMLLTTAMPGSARESRLRVNHRQNRRAGEKREANCGEQDELLHGDVLRQALAARERPERSCNPRLVVRL